MRRDGDTRPVPRLPRPNPGPEPWPEAGWPSPWWLALALPILGLAAWRSRRPKPAVAPVATKPTLDGDDATQSPDDRLCRLADRVRDRLSERFGPAWAAMTTEELSNALKAGSPIDGFPTDDALLLFRAADRAKFGAWAVDEDHLAEAGASAAAVLDALADGARSRMNGR